jgi:iron complex outermembrane receptor protein
MNDHRSARPAPRPLHIATLAALGAFTATTAAADLTLNPVVVTGSRSEAQSFDLPYSIDVVDSAQIGEGQLKVNASEALAGVPGIVVQNRQNYAQDLQISSRGYGSRSAFGVRGIKLISDGIPASTPDGQGQVATFNLDTAERIEVLRGPFSTVYGNGSGGVIQLFSRDGQGAPSASGGVMAGSWDTYKVDVGAEGEAGGLGYVLDVSRFDTNGYRDHSGATRDQSFGKLTFHPDEASKLSLIASSLEQNDTKDPLGLTWSTFQSDPRAVEASAVTFNTRKSIDHMQGGMNYERRIGAGTLQVNAYAGKRSVIQYLSIPAFVQASPTHSGGVVDFYRDFQGLGVRWIHKLALGPGELTLTGGLDYDRSEDDRQGYQNFIGATLGVKGALRRDETDTVTSTDPYVQATWQLGKWGLQAGLRHSHVKFEVDDDYLANGNDGGEVSYRKTTPAIGVTYQLSPSANLYASAARGYETPTLGELSYSSASGSFSFDLKPARSVQLEAGAKAFLGDNTRLNLAVFQIRTDDELVVATSSGGRTSYTNAASTLRQGVEIALDSELTRQLRGRLAYTLLRAIYDDDFTSRGTPVAEGRRLPGVPASSLFGELAWKPMNGLGAAVEMVYRSRVFVEDTNSARVAPSYTIFNLRLVAEQRVGQWKLAEMLRVDNIFDRSYIGSVIVGDGNGRYYEPGPGASVYGGLSARYTF